MKIAVATKDGKTLSAYFGGRTNYKIFDIKQGRIVDQCIRQNSERSNDNDNGDLITRQYNFNPQHTVVKALEDCEVIITQRMGRDVWDEFGYMGKEVIFTEESDVDQNVRYYLSDDLFKKFKMHH